jgi:omega-hydroxy-beta-dihydromenaquinone-9 sulfotransferase
LNTPSTQPAPPWNRLPGAIMPFDWPAFIEKHRVVTRDHGGWKTTLKPGLFRLAQFALGQACWAADEILHPDWRRAKFSGPLFILGHQRSGTTFLHRLLASDTVHARSLTFAEMLMPASCVQRAIARLGTWDRSRNGRLSERFQRFQDRLFSPMDPIHRLRFDEIEEDEFVFWTIFASAMCVNDSPLTTGNPRLDQLRHYHDWPLTRRLAAWSWYRACLLKKIHREPPIDSETPVWVVSKNPAFSKKIPDLLSTFPDGKPILLVRNPLEAIPSRLSLIRAIWRQRFPGFEQMTAGQVRTILADSIQTYLRAEADLADLPESEKLIIQYRDLTADPVTTVRKIYSHFGLPGPEGKLAVRLAELQTGRKSKKSAHRYDLSEFGLERSDIAEPLGSMMERYGFS